MNERNLKYIRPFNLKRAKKIADDKVKTKEILEAENIPTPKLLGVLQNKEDFDSFDWESLPKSFVMKPIHGLEGFGIEIFYNKDKNGNWIKSNKEKVSLTELKRRALDIMDGKYSLHNQKDGVLFEERVKTHKAFKYYAYKGAPDIRIIVFNNIPIMAMVRLPTKSSNGKGNLAQGAIGAGIDFVTGRTTTAIIGKGKLIETLPGTKLKLSGLKIPFWNNLLEIAIKAQKATNLGFAAIDFLIDRERGPLIIELNARPGLSIQIANQDGLRWRLKKVAGINVTTINKGIRIAKDLFGGEIEEKIETISGKQLISHIEPVQLFSQNSTKHIKTLALIDTSRRTTTIELGLAKKLGLLENNFEFTENQNSIRIPEISLKLADEIIQTDCKVIPRPIKGYKVLIGRKNLGKFLIDIRKIAIGKERVEKLNLMTNLPFTPLKKIDDTIYKISNLTGIRNKLRPTNLIVQKKKFFKYNKIAYNPQFTYKPIIINTDNILEKINNLRPNTNSFIGQLFMDKITEVRKKALLMESIGNDEIFPQRSEALFGAPNEEIFNQALEIIKNIPPIPLKTKKEKILKQNEVKEIIKQKLDELKLDNVKITFKTTGPTKASVKKSGKEIIINKNYKFTKRSLLGTIAHEIEVHLVRAYFGAKKEYKIFSYGTAKYIEIEEGLAIYNKAKVLESSQPIRNSAIMYVASFLGHKTSFFNTFKYLVNLKITETNAFRYTYRVKRGLSDTSNPGAYLKDSLYFTGYLKVKDMTTKQIKKLLQSGKTHILPTNFNESSN